MTQAEPGNELGPTPKASAADRATLLIAVGSASVAFTLGFNYGAFGVVFFDQVFTVWVIASVVFVASIVTRLKPRTWPRRLVLVIPSVWLIMSWLNNNTDLERIDDLTIVLSVIVVFVPLPFVGWILVTTINAEFAELPRRNKGAVLSAVGVFLVVGLLFGARNDLVLECEDFKVSGNDLPKNCVSNTTTTSAGG